MGIKRKTICRLCLKVIKNGFTEINEVIKQIFNILFLELELNITRHPIICQNCLEVAKKCLNFKSVYLDTERSILLYSTGRKNVKCDIKFIFNEREFIAQGIDENLGICRFCMTRLERNSFTYLDNLKNETTIFEMLPEYMQEMDFDIIENPLICTTCKENIEGYFKFMVNCLSIERKIKAYCNEEGNMNQVNLGKVLIFFKYISDIPGKYPQICAMKEKSNVFEAADCAYPETYSQLIKHEDLDITKRELNFEEVSYENPPKITSDEHGDMFLDKEFDKQTISDTIPLKIDPNTENQNTIHACTVCTYKTKWKSSLKYHLLIHKDVSEIKMHKCTFCAYETKWKRCLNKHLLLHKDVSKLKMYKCSFCPYESIRKHCLKNHLLVHKDISEIKMLKCSLCPYEARQKRSIKNHLLTHNADSEITKHKCSLCTYETNWKSNLKTHMVVHKDISEIQMFKCSLCDYESKRKGGIKSHLLVHKDISEVNMYKCSLCPYESRQNRSLKRHVLLVHKNVINE